MSQTPTVTPSATPTIPVEPIITFFGVARADGTVVDEPTQVTVTPEGIRVYQRPSFGFYLVAEGRPGLPTIVLGSSTFNWNASDPSVLPDLQAIVSKPLGDGSPAVCDDGPSMRGGVPPSSDFTATQGVANAISDLGCRFKNASGQPGGRGPNEACTRLPDGFDRFSDPTSTIQFCGFIDKPYQFPRGDTVVTVRIRDVAGNLSKRAQLIIRVP